ncbi:MAG: sulfite exporter TauE/SafE family protein [Aggregatilineales bacterium]
MDSLLVALIVFFACFVQTATGFGIGLVGMPLLAATIGLPIARPLMALVSLLNRFIMMARYRDQLTLRAAWRLMFGAAIGIPLGFLLLRTLDSHWVEVGLGMFVTIYALYALISPQIPEMHGHGWALGMGLASGILAGAYNAGGPPVVIYATGQRWEPERFKGNIQGFTLLNSVLVISLHFGEGNYTPDVLTLFLIVIPAILLGLYCGFKVDGLINPVLFRKLVLILLIVLGLSLVF